jgi:hypothetical protein
MASVAVRGYAEEIGFFSNPVPSYDIDLADLVLYTGYDISAFSAY